MKDRAQEHLRSLGQLAREYEQKFKELEDALADLEPEQSLRQLGWRGELTTDRFRAAQMALFHALLAQEEMDEEAYKASMALCSCFDEMRILFQVLLERSYPSGPEE